MVSQTQSPSRHHCEMGVQGLLKALRPLFSRDVHISKCFDEDGNDDCKEDVASSNRGGGGGGSSGCSSDESAMEFVDIATMKKESSMKIRAVAIDASAWLHRGAYNCAMDLARGVPTTRYADFFMRRIDMLKFFKIEPIVVFDGRSLSMKKSTDKVRRGIRSAAREKAEALFAEAVQSRRQHDKQRLYDEAARYFRKCITVTPEMVRHLITRLKNAGVEFLVAPFEADVQMAFLATRGRVSGIITEDSDLVPFCMALDARPFVLMKMTDEGNGDVLRIAPPSKIVAANSPLCFDAVKASSVKSTRAFLDTISKFDVRMFVQMIVLSGCDYIPSLPGIGIFKAPKLIWSYRMAEPQLRIKRIVTTGITARQKKAECLSNCNEWLSRFARAEALFFHQFVFAKTLCGGYVMLPAVEVGAGAGFSGAEAASCGDWHEGDIDDRMKSSHVQADIATGRISPKSFLPVGPQIGAAQCIFSKSRSKRSIAALKKPRPKSDYSYEKFFGSSSLAVSLPSAAPLPSAASPAKQNARTRSRPFAARIPSPPHKKRTVASASLSSLKTYQQYCSGAPLSRSPAAASSANSSSPMPKKVPQQPIQMQKQNQNQKQNHRAAGGGGKAKMIFIDQKRKPHISSAGGGSKKPRQSSIFSFFR